jgi:predicted amidohydrolase
MTTGVLNIASCQFPVSADIVANAKAICRLMEKPAKDKADIAHFPNALYAVMRGRIFNIR